MSSSFTLHTGGTPQVKLVLTGPLYLPAQSPVWPGTWSLVAGLCRFLQTIAVWDQGQNLTVPIQRLPVLDSLFMEVPQFVPDLHEVPFPELPHLTRE